MRMNKQHRLSVEFIAVGSELLSSSFPETNSLFLAEKLEEIGLTLSFKSAVSDRLSDIKETINIAKKRSQIIFLSGGLGPTEDDRTKEALALAVKRKLVFQPEILKNIRKRFAQRGLKMPESNRKQAYVIEGAEILENTHGTAPGQWLKIGKNIFILLPGPPGEFKPMLENLVISRLKQLSQQKIIRAFFKITGAGESWVEDKLKPVYKILPPFIDLTILASPGDIQLILSSKINSEAEENLKAKELEKIKKKISHVLGKKIYAFEPKTLEEAVAEKLTNLKKTVATAESCSGGLLAHRLTNVPGSSAYFRQGLVTYSNEAKVSLLGVPEELINKKGAVSREVAQAMARGLLEKAGVDLAVSTTGIAGPGGGSKKKPVGLVYIGLASQDGVKVERCRFSGSRQQIKFQTTQKALDMLRLKLIELERAKR